MQKQVIEGYRMSPAQRRLWALQQDNPAYHARCAMVLDGELDLAALQRALRRVISRHEALRTSFQCLPGMGMPIQVVGRVPERLLLAEVEERRCGEAEQAREIERLLAQAGEGEYEAGEGEAVRLRLIRMSERRQVLVVRVKGLCGDVRTMMNVFE